MPCRRDAWALESGQMLVNKRGQSGMNLAALVLAEAMQKDHEFWFQISEGVRCRDRRDYAYGTMHVLTRCLSGLVMIATQDKDTFVSHSLAASCPKHNAPS